MQQNHILIVSLPRSGSTVLTNLLDLREDIVCLPECMFPPLIDMLELAEFRKKRKVAEMFLASCTDGFPMSVEEIERCIMDTPTETIDSIVAAFTRLSGRDPDKIRAFVWKSTRMVGCHQFWQESGGRFVILKRPPLNVYESQFRVHFGQKNRNPIRFALFESSYRIAFRNYPEEATFRIEYAEIPRRLEELVGWFGSAGLLRNDGKAGSLNSTSSKQYWHANIDKPFENNDEQKINNLSSSQIAGYRLGKLIFSFVPYLVRAARKAADRRQMKAIRNAAAGLAART